MNDSYYDRNKAMYHNLNVVSSKKKKDDDDDDESTLILLKN